MKLCIVFTCLCIGFVMGTSVQQSDNVSITSTIIPQISTAQSPAHVIDNKNDEISADVQTVDNSNDHSRKSRGITIGVGGVGLAGGIVSAPVYSPYPAYPSYPSYYSYAAAPAVGVGFPVYAGAYAHIGGGFRERFGYRGFGGYGYRGYGGFRRHW